jgi:hypothetical protein
MTLTFGDVWVDKEEMVHDMWGVETRRLAILNKFWPLLLYFGIGRNVREVVRYIRNAIRRLV